MAESGAATPAEAPSTDASARLPTLERLAARAIRDGCGTDSKSVAVLATHLGLTKEEVRGLARRGLALIDEARY
jgi:hypothetical protein